MFAAHSNVAQGQPANGKNDSEGSSNTAIESQQSLDILDESIAENSGGKASFWYCFVKNAWHAYGFTPNTLPLIICFHCPISLLILVSNNETLPEDGQRNIVATSTDPQLDAEGEISETESENDHANAPDDGEAVDVSEG